MIITKKSLARRTFLRGMGAAVALPLLDAMVPALTAQSRTAAAAVPRLGFLYIPNGINQQAWFPREVGRGAALTRSLAPLMPLQEHVTVFSGISHPNAYSLGDGAADHARGSAVWLNGMHPKRTEGEDVRAGITADQVAARAIGLGTPLPSLELALEGTTALGTCDAGYSCTYMNTISWLTATTPLPMEQNPRVVFERLFGRGGTPQERAARLARQRSILDSVTGEMARLRRQLGPRDTQRVTEYLDSVREIERRIQLAERQSDLGVTLPDQPSGVPESYDEHARVMFELVRTAFQADLTRVFTLMLGHEVTSRTFPQIDVNEAHHGVSHHQGNPEKLEQYARVNTYQVSLFAELITLLSNTPDADGSLLDHAALVYGSGLGDGNLHNHSGLATLVAGHAHGAIRGGAHIVCEDETPMSNVLLTVLQRSGIPEQQFGDSTGTVEM